MKGIQGKSAAQGDTYAQLPAAGAGYIAGGAGLLLGGGVGLIIALHALVKLKCGQDTESGRSGKLPLLQQGVSRLPEGTEQKGVMGNVLLAAISGITMAAGGYLLYRGLSSAFKEADPIITSTDVPGTFTDIPLATVRMDNIKSILDTLQKIKEKAKNNRLGALAEGFQEEDRARKITFRKKRDHGTGDIDYLNDSVARLLKYIQITENYLKENNREDLSKYFEIHGDLWKFANSIPEIKPRINKFKEEHPNDELMRNNVTRLLFGMDFSKTELQNKIQESMQKQVSQTNVFSSPILHPDAWLYKKISGLIQQFKDRHPGSTDIKHITPETMISVVWSLPDTVNPYDIVPFVKTGQRSPPIEYSLTDIAAGIHIRDKQSSYIDPISYTIPGQEATLSSLPPEKRALPRLIEYLQHVVRNMEKVMLDELKMYKNNSAHKQITVVFFRSMMTLRCLQYIDKYKEKPTTHTESVMKFLMGEIQGYELFYNGAQVNGVFIVGRLLLSIDDTTEEILVFPWRDFDYDYDITLPGSEEFKNWFFSKLPKKHHYHRSVFPGRQKRYHIAVNAKRISGLRLVPHESPQALAERLFEGYIERLESDIDTLIWSEAEQNQMRLLDFVKMFATIAGVAIGGVGIFSGGSIPLIIATITSGLAASSLDIWASLRQAGIVDTEEQRVALIQDVVIAGTFASVGFLAGDLPQLKGAVKKLLSRYNTFKSASTSSARSLYDKAKVAPDGRLTDGGAGWNVNVIPKEGSKTLPLFKRHANSNAFWDATRSLQNTSGTPSRWKCISNILEKGGMLSATSASTLNQRLISAANGQGSIEALFHPDTRKFISSTEELIAVPAGQMVVVSREGKAVHAMVGVGNGRFAGAGNAYIDAGLGESVSIITAEEVGIISRQGSGVSLPRSRVGDAELRIDTGYPVGYSRTAIPPVVPSSGSRIQDLLGPDSVLDFLHGNTRLLEVTMHGAPAVSNYMDGGELYHAIRGLVINKHGLEAFKAIETIRLQSCYGAWWGKYSSGQILANFSGKQVEAYWKVLSARNMGEAGWWTRNKTIFQPNPESVSDGSFALLIHKKLHRLQMQFLSVRRTIQAPRRATRDAVIRTDLELLSPIVKFCTQEPRFTVQNLIEAMPSFTGHEVKLKEMADALPPVDDYEFMERCSALIMCEDRILKMFIN
ncbi:hypothetical protein NFK84_20495 [Enterobacter ludwigii]|uniref:hypothetical protein n=1 Tax=Enterobacter ludwigii TaxID=299767 RepID=UPI00242DF843|nr:hypothetical protein [Enterobacter ludwigii]WGA04024.1 hypothetical protein NFK84_20495 [Enterobacter ludwigii]